VGMAPSDGVHQPRSAPVGSYASNPWGVYDILGNVSEWVEDCYVDNYREAPTDGSAVITSDCTDRVLRGGNWRFSPQTARAADRSHLFPGVANYTTGFRLVRMVAR